MTADDTPDKLDLLIAFAMWTKTKPWSGFKYSISKNVFKVWFE